MHSLYRQQNAPSMQEATETIPIADSTSSTTHLQRIQSIHKHSASSKLTHVKEYGEETLLS